MQPSIKGVNCITTLAFAKEALGSRWDGFVQRLPDTPKWHATRRILSIEWVPLNEWYPIEEAIFDQLCGNSEEAYYAFSRQVVQSEFNSVYRAFLKVPGPSYVLDKAARIFATYFNTGGLHVVARVTAPSKQAPFVLEMHMPGRYPLMVVSIAAGFDAILGLTRAKDVTVSTEERRLEEDGIFARYSLTWTD